MYVNFILCFYCIYALVTINKSLKLDIGILCEKVTRPRSECITAKTTKNSQLCQLQKRPENLPISESFQIKQTTNLLDMLIAKCTTFLVHYRSFHLHYIASEQVRVSVHWVCLCVLIPVFTSSPALSLVTPLPACVMTPLKSLPSVTGKASPCTSRSSIFRNILNIPRP